MATIHNAMQFQGERIAKKLNEINGRQEDDPLGWTQLNMLSVKEEQGIPVLQIMRRIEKDVDDHVKQVRDSLKGLPDDD